VADIRGIYIKKPTLQYYTEIENSYEQFYLNIEVILRIDH